jgi:hypothetical protein
MSKNKAALLSSRLQQWNVLDNTMNVTAFRSRQKDFEQFITQGEISPRMNVANLMAAMNMRFSPEEWLLFIASSVRSLKAVLLHKGKVLPSIPVAYAVRKKEHENTKEILCCFSYETYQWHIRGD